MESIKSKVELVKKSRNSVQSKLLDLENSLKNAFDGLSFSAQSSTITLQQTNPDDYIYGYLSFYEGTINIAYRSTDNDFSDAMNRVPEEFQAYQVQHISVCVDDWLESLSQENVVNSLLYNIDLKLQKMVEKSDTAIKTLESTLQNQSSKLADSCQEELVQIGDVSLLKDWIRARQTVQLDASDSVTRTSSYIESVCRKILTERAIPLPKTNNISNLINLCEKTLSLKDDVYAENDVRSIIGGLKGVVGGIGSLRTHFGTAHGKSPNDFEIDTHYARLANDSAAAVSVFLLYRHKSKLNKPINQDK